MTLPEPVPAYSLYGEEPRAPDEATVHIETIAARSASLDWTIQPHRHRDLHQVLLLSGGGVRARFDERSVSVRSPGIVLVPPGVVHAFYFQPGTVGLVASFAATLAAELTAGNQDMLGFFEHARAVHLAKATRGTIDVVPLSQMLLREFERCAPGRECALRGLLGALLANVYRVASRPVDEANGAVHEAGHGGRQRELVARFREAAEKDFRKHLSIAAYCRALRISVSMLRRACLSATGRPPIALLHLRLLIEAQRQLRYTDMPVTQIAYHLGFEDPAYFTRFFKRGTGVAPKLFRERGSR